MPKYIPPRRVNTSSRSALDDRIRIGLRLRVLASERNAHLHGPRGAHRVAVLEERAPQRDAADHVLECLRQVALGPGGIDALAVRPAVGGLDRQRRVERELRHSHLLAPALDLGPGDGRQVGDRGIGAKPALLLGDRHDGADVVRRHRDSSALPRPCGYLVAPAARESVTLAGM